MSNLLKLLQKLNSNLNLISFFSYKKIFSNITWVQTEIFSVDYKKLFNSLVFLANKYYFIYNNNKSVFSFKLSYMYLGVFIFFSCFLVFIIFLIPFLNILTIFMNIFLMVLASAYISLSESHMVAVMQSRVGPSMTGGSFGLLQPLMDGLKLMLKEYTYPNKSGKFMFLFSPMYTFFMSLLLWTTVSIDMYPALFFDSSYMLVVLISLLVVNSYGVIMGSWFSNNKFAILGAVSSMALSVSYGLSITLIFLTPCFIANSFNLSEIMVSQQTGYYMWICFPIAILFWMTMLTEMKKIPFDVSESEAELGSGFLMEYSATNFAIFVVSEYIYIMLLLTLFNSLFLGGMLVLGFISWFFFFMKVTSLMVLYFIMRSILPNFSFDQIMLLHWKYMLPITLVYWLFMVWLL